MVDKSIVAAAAIKAKLFPDVKSSAPGGGGAGSGNGKGNSNHTRLLSQLKMPPPQQQPQQPQQLQQQKKPQPPQSQLPRQQERIECARFPYSKPTHTF